VQAIEAFNKDYPDQPWILARLAAQYETLGDPHGALICARRAYNLIVERAQPIDSILGQWVEDLEVASVEESRKQGK
jgi:hypothetical protein